MLIDKEVCGKQSKNKNFKRKKSELTNSSAGCKLNYNKVIKQIKKNFFLIVLFLPEKRKFDNDKGIKKLYTFLRNSIIFDHCLNKFNLAHLNFKLPD